MKFHIQQAGLWLKPNTASQLKPDMPQADICSDIIEVWGHFFSKKDFTLSSVILYG